MRGEENPGFTCYAVEGSGSGVDGTEYRMKYDYSSLSGEEHRIRVFFQTLVVSSKQ